MSTSKSFLRRLSLEDELSRERAAASLFTIEQREYLRRAKVAFELGDLSLVPGSAVRSGSTAPLTANLFRQSLYWALLAQKPASAGSSPEAAWLAAGEATLALAAPAEADRARIATAMSSTFVELAEGSLDIQRVTIKVLRRAAKRLSKNAERAASRLQWVQLKRVVRLALALAVCLAPLAVGVALLARKPDLARGMPWHTSSVGAVCHPETLECAGATTAIFFHTNLEKEPWFEYDFGAPLSFSSLTIRNRSDFGADLAAPLVVEVSNDDQNFQEIARRTEVFWTWRPSFPTHHARYLRLRVPRQSILHLEAVQVHP